MSDSTGFKGTGDPTTQKWQGAGTDGAELRDGMVRHVKIPMGWLYQVVICTVTIETKMDGDGRICERRELRSLQWSQPVNVLAPKER